MRDKKVRGKTGLCKRVLDPHHVDADPDPPRHFAADPACHFDADLDPTFHFDADPNPSFQITAQNLKKSANIGSYSIHFGLSSAN
jgi:hypothetical protein